MDRARFSAARGLLSLACAVFAGCLGACSGGGSAVPPAPSSAQLSGGGQSNVTLQAYDALSGGPCDISYDGLIWYSVPSGAFPPTDAAFARCRASGSLHVNPMPSVPAWSHPAGQTQAIFVVTSLMENPFSPPGVAALHSVAAAAHVPVTWLVGNVAYLQNGNYEIFNQYHAQFGDDVEMEDNLEFITVGPIRFPWYVPEVSAEGAGHERMIGRLMSFGEHGFWGITWDSLNIDGTSDRGAPWGTYCADVASYKRPSPTGNCTLVSFEWTARDLTRAYFSGFDDYYSTDPDDVLLRGQFGVQGGSNYVRSLVDAYAAAGASQPLVMMAQQEAPEMIDGAPGDATVLAAMYHEAVAVGMKPMTLASALPLAQTFSNRPRAIAFPFVAGGYTFPRNGSSLYPSTMDYHDNVAGMTFIGGHTTPSRVFEYAQDPVSYFNVPLTPLSSSQFPKLTMVAASGGKLYFHFTSTTALHYGVALWADPSTLGLSGSNVSVSGRAGAVITFDVPVGASDQSVSCTNCSNATFPLSL